MERIQGKVSPWRQIWHRWKSLRGVPLRRSWFVGYDLEGNSFWEFRIERGGKLRRRVEYLEKRGSIAEYSMKKVDPRWSSWLTFTRPTPPSLHELVAEEQRQQVMKLLAAQADQRWRNESVLAEDNRVLHEKILATRKAISERGTAAQPVEEKNTLQDPWHQHKDETPIETAVLQPRR